MASTICGAGFLATTARLEASLGNAPNVTATTFNVTGGYLTGESLSKPEGIFPLSTGGSAPFQPLLLNGAGQPDGHDCWLRR
jgi:hypothetical protein